MRVWVWLVSTAQCMMNGPWGVGAFLGRSLQAVSNDSSQRSGGGAGGGGANVRLDLPFWKVGGSVPALVMHLAADTWGRALRVQGKAALGRMVLEERDRTHAREAELAVRSMVGVTRERVCLYLRGVKRARVCVRVHGCGHGVHLQHHWHSYALLMGSTLCTHNTFVNNLSLPQALHKATQETARKQHGAIELLEGSILDMTVEMEADERERRRILVSEVTHTLTTRHLGATHSCSGLFDGSHRLVVTPTRRTHASYPRIIPVVRIPTHHTHGLSLRICRPSARGGGSWRRALPTSVGCGPSMLPRPPPAKTAHPRPAAPARCFGSSTPWRMFPAKEFAWSAIRWGLVVPRRHSMTSPKILTAQKMLMRSMGAASE